MDRCQYNKFVGCNAKGCNVKGCNTCEVYVVYQRDRADAIQEVKERMQNEISFTRIQKRLMIYILDKMKGEL